MSIKILSLSLQTEDDNGDGDVCRTVDVEYTGERLNVITVQRVVQAALDAAVKALEDLPGIEVVDATFSA